MIQLSALTLIVASYCSWIVSICHERVDICRSSRLLLVYHFGWRTIIPSILKPSQLALAANKTSFRKIRKPGSPQTCLNFGDSKFGTPHTNNSRIRSTLTETIYDAKVQVDVACKNINKQYLVCSCGSITLFSFKWRPHVRSYLHIRVGAGSPSSNLFGSWSHHGGK